MKLSISKEKMVHIFEQIGYFSIAIAFFNTFGAWLPFVIDLYYSSKTTPDTLNVTPSNLLTYFAGLIAVAFVDRMNKVLKMEKHPSKFLEFIGWMIILILTIADSIIIMKYLRDKLVYEAINFSFLGVALSWIIWWFVYYKPYKSDPYSSLGGNSFD